MSCACFSARRWWRWRKASELSLREVSPAILLPPSSDCGSTTRRRFSGAGFFAARNCVIRGPGAGALSAAERDELATLLEPIAAEFREPGIRIAARNALSTLRAVR